MLLILFPQKTVNSNLFSKHDNRHAFQSSGVYFGQGLGKRLVKDPKINQHHSENHTSWNTAASHFSTYKDGYGRGLTRRRCSSVTEMAATQAHHCCRHSTLKMDKNLLDRFEVVTKENFRRFPHSHSLPSNLSSMAVRPSEKTVWWHRIDMSKIRKGSSASSETRKEKGKEFVTSLSVLAATQQPFLKHNPWTYSYKKWRANLLILLNVYAEKL